VRKDFEEESHGLYEGVTMTLIWTYRGKSGKLAI
jgi:hypothetical protein